MHNWETSATLELVAIFESAFLPLQKALPLTSIDFANRSQVLRLAHLPRAAAVPMLHAIDQQEVSLAHVVRGLASQQRYRRQQARPVFETSAAARHTIPKLLADCLSVRRCGERSPVSCSVAASGTHKTAAQIHGSIFHQRVERLALVSAF